MTSFELAVISPAGKSCMGSTGGPKLGETGLGKYVMSALSWTLLELISLHEGACRVHACFWQVGFKGQALKTRARRLQWCSSEA